MLTEAPRRLGPFGTPPRRSDHTTSSLLSRLSTPSAFVAVVAGSAILGVIMSIAVPLATVHLLIVLGGVVVVGLISQRVDLVLAVTVYAGLCDVLWRTSHARGPWEGAKYALIVGFGAVAVRFVRRPKDIGVVGAFILVLVPGAVMGMLVLGPGAARPLIAANLGGPVALALAVLACSSLRLTPDEVRGLYLVALSPIVAVTAQATLSTVQSKDLGFTDEVNFAASGGFGPNQVSSILCFGGLLCVLIVLQHAIGWRLRALALCTGIWLVGQAILTFSRGGVFALVLAGGAVLLASLVSSGQRARVLVAAGILVLVAVQLLSWAGAFTDGESNDRLSSTDSTNRTEIAAADLRLFAQKPILGAGVGVSPSERDYPGNVAPHTEYTRLLAEHGLFGVAAIGLLALICFRILRRSRGWYRLAAVGLLVMALAQMMHSATRIGSIAVAFGLAALQEDDG